MVNYQECFPIIDRPAEAVGDAMMIAQAQLLRHALSQEEILSSPEIAVFRGTDGMCNRASIYVLAHLKQKYSELFPRMGIIRAEHGIEPLKNRRWRFHDYFLAQDINGKWYAGSPANYDGPAKENRFTRVISSLRLQEVMGRIQEIEGGRWPLVNDIILGLADMRAGEESNFPPGNRVRVVMYGNQIAKLNQVLPNLGY